MQLAQWQDVLIRIADFIDRPFVKVISKRNPATIDVTDTPLEYELPEEPWI